MTARSQATLVALITAACFLPGEPSGSGRVTFVLDFAQPYRVPLAGDTQPPVKITADGQVLSGPSYHLESLDPGVVHVDPTGRGLEGLARGTASVRVVYETATGAPDTTFTVRVVVSRVAVSSASLAFTRLVDTSRLSATAYDAKDAAVPSVRFTWSSAEPHVASVDTAGLVRALNEGTVAITAEADNVAGSSSVSVTQVAAAVRMVPKLDTLRTVGRSTQFLARAFDDTNGVIRAAKPHWSSSNETVAGIDTAGLVTATGAGAAKIIARVGTAADTATIVVAQIVRFLVVKPAFDTLTAIADTARHTALAFDSLNFPIPRPTVTWASGDTAVATVDATGLVRATKNGAVLVTASAVGQSAFATIVVRQQTVTAQVSPHSVGLVGAGDTVRLGAVGLDRNGYPVPGASFAWHSGSECVATVNAGLVTARGGGETAIIAALLGGGRSDTAAVSVTGASSGQAAIAYAMTPDSTWSNYNSENSVWGLCPGSGGGIVLVRGPVVTGEWLTYPSWSPDGGRLAFGSEDWWSCGDVFTARPDGSELRLVTPYEPDRGYGCSNYRTSPAWSPDGTQIAFSDVFVVPGGNSFGIGIVNADGSNYRSFRVGGDWASRPTWSPDGTKLAFHSGAGILVMNADGTGVVQLNPNIGCTCVISGPAWSPDGSQIAFEAVGVWVMNPDGSGARALTGGSTPAWSPDGSRLVFSRSDGLYVINRDGTGLQRMASIPGATSPAWRADAPSAGSAAVRTARTGSRR